MLLVAVHGCYALQADRDTSFMRQVVNSRRDPFTVQIGASF
jgi:hypothetical protein